MSVYTKNVWTDNVTPVDKAHMDVIENGVFASQFRDEKGVANGYASLDANTKVPAAQIPAQLLAYVELAAMVGIVTAGVDVIGPVSAVCDGGPIWVEAYIQSVQFQSASSTNGDSATFRFYMDGADVSGNAMTVIQMNATIANTYQPIGMIGVRLTPSAGSHSFKLFAVRAVQTGLPVMNVIAGAGTASANPKAWLRVRKEF